MGLFDALKEAAASKMEAAKEERQERQRKAAEEMAWREREPEISLEALNVPVPMDAYDFDSIPTVVNDSMTARKGTQYASGKNFETISRELKEVVAEIISVKSHAEVRANVCRRLLWFKAFNPKKPNYDRAITVDFGYWYTPDDEDDMKEWFDALEDDESVMSVSCSNSTEGSFDVVAEFGKTGRIIEMDITASFEKGEVTKFVDVHAEPKGKSGYKVAFVVSD